MLCVEKYQKQNTNQPDSAREAAQMISAYVNSKVQAEEEELEQLQHKPSANKKEDDDDDDDDEPEYTGASRISAAELDGILSMSLAGTYKQ